MSSSGLDVEEFLAGYLAEAAEHLQASNGLLVAIEASQRKREPNPRAVRELFRALHTMKGLSAMVGAEPIVDLTHEMETLLRAADRSGGRLPPSAVDLLVKGLKAVEVRVAALRRREPVPAAPSELVAELNALRVDGPATAGSAGVALEPELAAKLSLAEHEQMALGLAHGRHGRRVEFVPSPERAARGETITSVRERIAKLGDLVKVVPRSTGSGVAFLLLVLTDASDEALAEAAGTTADRVQPVTLNAPRAAAPEEDAVPTDSRNYLRVDVRRLDDALERLSALVVTRAKLERAVARLHDGSGDLRALSAIVQENARQLRDLRGAIMRARMLPATELLERAPLVVRGLARASGKPVHLDAQITDAELDKTVADRLFPALVHLLRNAVDHAIEPSAERREAGKPEEGRITIGCSTHAARELQLTISDDGRGIDKERVAARAGAQVPRDDVELLELICRPGLSTMDAPTHTSGRGIGMDVVRKVVVQDLGGELTLSTTPGKGTTFTLRVPLSVTIVDAFSFVCGSEVFAVPVSSVDDLAELSADRVVSTPEPPGHAGTHVQLFRHRGTAIPLYPLAVMLGGDARPPERAKVIITRQGNEAVGFQVDRLIGKQEIAIRPLTDPLAVSPGIAGSTDLGDGKPTLVLDLPALAARHHSRKVVSS